MQKSYVLITGASCFIGSYLVPYLLARDYGVIGHPIWQILADMRMSGGRLYQLLAFIGARLRV